uniref:Tspb protein n=1 Tax=Dulem virus 62 TaxID=3145773 RepID=A0AAU8B376_9VIRU
MRFAVFVFSALLIFSTTYAHVLIFIPAVQGALLRTVAGKFVKVASSSRLLAAGGWVSAYCLANKKKCKDLLGDFAEYFFDDEDDNSCKLLPYYRTNSYKGFSLEKAKNTSVKDITTAYKHNYVSHESTNIDKASDEVKRRISNNSDNKFTPIVATDSYKYKNTYSSGNTSIGYGSYSVSMEARSTCNLPEEQKEQEKKELVNKIVEKLSDDDINYIINNYGDQINIDKYCASAGACAELEQSFGDEVMNNKDKYDIDKITKENCEVENDKIISCDKAKKEEDKDDEEKEEEENKKEDDKEKDDKIKCDSTAFHKKVCDFIDWYQDDEELKDDDKLDVKDLSKDLKINDDKISFGRSCPSGGNVSINFAGVAISKELNYQGLCDAFTKMRPFVIGIGWIVGAMIIGGRRV